MSDLQTKLQLAEKACLQQNKKLTTKRRHVLSLLLSQAKAISVYELIDLFPQQFQEEISPMSTYRILEFLEGVHLVHKINIANKYIACAHIGEEHDHQLPQFLICTKCQRVNELENNVSNFAEVSLEAQKTGYQLSSPQIELSCICNTCL